MQQIFKIRFCRYSNKIFFSKSRNIIKILNKICVANYSEATYCGMREWPVEDTVGEDSDIN